VRRVVNLGGSGGGFLLAREQGRGKGEADESGENGSSAGAVQKAKTRGKQRENRGSRGETWERLAALPTRERESAVGWRRRS